MWLSTIFIGLIVNLAFSLLNIITPRLYQKGQIEINILADLFAVGISCNLADKLLEEKHRVFCAVNCILLAGLHIFSIYAALITPKEYRDPYYGSVAFLVAYVFAIGWFFSNMSKNSDKKDTQFSGETVTQADKKDFSKEPNINKQFLCRKCGTHSSGWYQTCPFCGAVGQMVKAESISSIKIDESVPHSSPVIVPTVTLDAEMTKPVDIYCRNCGAKLEPDSIFCSYCGFRLDKQ